MRRQRVLTSSVICGTLITLLATGGCRREEPGEPTPMLQSETTQPTNHPISTAGCLLAGETADTFMLMAAQADGSGQTKNYQLVASGDMNFRDHVGQRVEVSGTVEQRHAAQIQTFATPAEQEGDRGERAAGTTGETPTVQTQTNVAVDRLTVEKLSPVGERCQM